MKLSQYKKHFKDQILYKDFQPCKHPGCAHHLSHPCEECGRMGARGVVYETENGIRYIIDERVFYD